MEAGALNTSVVTYSVCAAACIGILILRRFVAGFGKGELGGPTGLKLASGITMIMMWVIYVLISTMVAYGKLNPI